MQIEAPERASKINENPVTQKEQMTHTTFFIPEHSRNSLIIMIDTKLDFVVLYKNYLQ